MVPKNLEQKIFTLLEDIDKLNKWEAAKVIQRLVELEIKFLETEHYLNRWDLTEIKSVAIKVYTDLPKNRLEELGEEGARTFAYVSAINGFMRREGLSSLIFKYEDEKE